MVLLSNEGCICDCHVKNQEIFNMKGVFVIMDGVADESCQILGGKTPLEFAKTPYLDEIAKRAKLDYCYPIKQDVAPESSSAVLSLLGYDYDEVSRGILEAVGAGAKLRNGDLAFRFNFASVDGLDNGGEILDSGVGRTLSTKEAKVLAAAVTKGLKGNERFKFDFFPTIQHRGVLIFRGGFSDNISDANPFYSGGKSVMSGRSAKFVFSKPLDDEDDSKFSADLLNHFIRHSHNILDKHPINIERARKGLYMANAILCRGAGNEVPRLKKMRGRWMALGYMPLEQGVAKSAKMDVYRFKYPKLKGIDAYANLYDGLNSAIKYAIKMLKRKRKKYDYFYIHLKETDVPGHDNKPFEKAKMIELIDKKFFSFLRGFLAKNKAKLVLTADHTTACRTKGHTATQVPVLTYPHEGKVVEGQRFTEKDGMKGKKILGKKLLEEKMYGR